MWRWQKLGLIFEPDPGRPWMQSHASLPTPVQLEGSLYRVFFASRDDQNRSSVGYFDLDLENAGGPVSVSAEPVLAPGPLGHFDDHGVYPASIVRDGNEVLLYTIGWNPGKEAPLFYATIGLAVGTADARSFRKSQCAPIMARSKHDPCLVTSPMVVKEGERWRMWYVSGYRWERTEKGLQSFYRIKYAESKNGREWKRNGLVCIDHASRSETNISRACVLRDGDIYRAWYGYSSSGEYKLGLAESSDGYTWKRRDGEVGIGVSAHGWDSQAVAYPFVIRHDDRYFMLYNGNRFGKDGIGLAVGKLV